MSKRSRKNSAKRKGGRRIWPWLLLGSPLLIWSGIVGVIDTTSSPYIYENSSEMPSAPVGIVFGAGVLKNGQPSEVLKERLDGAIKLYRDHKVSRLLMSGDNRTSHYNEPRAMRAYALKHRVDPGRILMDYAGRDTYDTCYRAKRVFGFDKAILITQSFHAPRAVFISRSFGIDTVAYGLKGFESRSRFQIGSHLREVCADLKAVWDVSISHRHPYVENKSRNLVARADL
jgi:SanA protein